MSIFRSDYKIVDKDGLRVIFNLKTPRPQVDGPPRETVAFTEEELKDMIRDVKGGGQAASLEQQALYDLQRQKQLGGATKLGRSKLIPPQTPVKTDRRPRK